MQIGKTKIGDNHPTFIIAEMSANHGHDINKAKELIYAAKDSGANAPTKNKTDKAIIPGRIEDFL